MIKKFQIHKIDIEIYNQRVYLAICDENEVTALGSNFIESSTESELKLIPDESSAASALSNVMLKDDYDVSTGHLVILPKVSCKISNIVHEVTHIVDYIFESIGEENAGYESRAYLTAFIFNKVYNLYAGSTIDSRVFAKNKN